MNLFPIRFRLCFFCCCLLVVLKQTLLHGFQPSIAILWIHFFCIFSVFGWGMTGPSARFGPCSKHVGSNLGGKHGKFLFWCWDSRGISNPHELARFFECCYFSKCIKIPRVYMILDFFCFRQPVPDPYGREVATPGSLWSWINRAFPESFSMLTGSQRLLLSIGWWYQIQETSEDGDGPYRTHVLEGF